MSETPAGEHSGDNDALRAEIAEVVYRELGDMVNRDYLIDALMPLLAQTRAESAAEALYAAADQVPDKTVMFRVYDATRVPMRLDYISPTKWLRDRGDRALARVTASTETAEGSSDV